MHGGHPIVHLSELTDTLLDTEGEASELERRVRAMEGVECAMAWTDSDTLQGTDIAMQCAYALCSHIKEHERLATP